MLIQIMTVLVDSGVSGAPEAACVAPPPAFGGQGFRRPDEQQQRQRRQHRNAHPQKRVAPPDGADRLAAEIRDQPLAQRLAARHDPDGEADAGFEPPAGICDHRREQAATADETADEEDGVELPQLVGETGNQHHDAHRDGAQQHGPPDADGF